MGKVIELRSKKVISQEVSSDLMQVNASDSTPIIDMTQARQEILSKERREIKRTLLTEFIGAYVVLPDQGLMKVSIYDISDNGMAFDLGSFEGSFQSGDEVAMRIYLNHSTYFPFTIKVTNGRMIENEGVIRHGATFEKGTINDVALHHFVKFIENISATLKTDSGDILVSNIS